MGCQPYPARWVKPEGSYLRGSTGELAGDVWQDAELTFVPAKDGVVSLRIRGRPFASAGDNELLPVWTYFDDVAVEGADLTNGGFEEVGAEGLPEGWKYYTPSHTQVLPLVIAEEGAARAGQRCVKVWYSGALSYDLRVEAGKQIAVRAKARGEVGQ